MTPRRWHLALALAACGAAAVPSLEGPIFVNPATIGQTLPEFALLFDFNDATECGCQSSVAAGSHGETVTNLHDGGAMCAKGDLVNNIEVGDLVWCTSDKVRVMSGGSGSLGVLSEVTAKNYNSSQTFNSAPWNAVGIGATAPTASAPGATTCPDSTVSATRITIPATGAAGRSFMQNAAGCPSGGPTAASMYVKGVSYDGGFTMRFNDIDATLLHYSVNTWTRVGRVLPSTGGTPWYFGLDSAVMSGGAQALPATDFYVCHAQCEIGEHFTSFTPDVRDMDRVRATAFVPLGSDLVATATLLPEGDITSYPVSIDHTYAVFLGPQVTETVGARGLNTWSSISQYIRIDGGYIGSLTREVANDVSFGWSPLGVVTATGSLSPDTFPGVSFTCINGSCLDAGHTYGAMGTVINDSVHVDFGGVPSLADYGGQPDAIIKDVELRSQARKYVFVYGDSIVGDGPSAEVLHNLMWLRRGASYAVMNRGESGHTIAQCKTRWDATLDVVRATPGLARHVDMLVQCGTNSLPDDTTIISTLKEMLAAGVDAGVNVTWATITPRDDYCTELANVNAELTSWSASHGVRVADTFTPLWQGVLCNVNPSYASDSTHPNDAGAVVMVNEWIQAAGW